MCGNKKEKFKSIKDLKQEVVSNSDDLKREHINIAIIDKSSTSLHDLLVNHGYKKTNQCKGGFYYSQLEYYQIILCNMDNIEVDEDSSYYYEQIHELYPYKTILFYSNVNQGKYFDVANKDCIVFKQADIIDKVREIDKVIIKYSNPLIAWEEILTICKQEKVSLEDIAIIEDTFVNSLNNKRNLFNRNRKILKLKELVDYISDMVDILIKQ